MNVTPHYEIHKIDISSTSKVQFALLNGRQVKWYTYEEIQEFVSKQFVLNWIKRVCGTIATKEGLILSHAHRIASHPHLCHVYYQGTVILACPWEKLTQIFPCWDNNGCNKNLDLTQLVSKATNTAPKWQASDFAKIIHAIFNKDMSNHVINTMNWQQIDHILWWFEYFGTFIECSFLQQMVNVFTDTLKMKQVANKCASNSFKRSLKDAILYRHLKIKDSGNVETKNDASKQSEESVLNNDDASAKKFIDNYFHLFYRNNIRALGSNEDYSIHEIRKLGQNLSEQMTPYLLLRIGEQLIDIYEANEKDMYMRPVGLCVQSIIYNVYFNHHAFIHKFLLTRNVGVNVLFHITMVELNALLHLFDTSNRKYLLNHEMKYLAMICGKRIFSKHHLKSIIELLNKFVNQQPETVFEHFLTIIDVTRSVTMTNYPIASTILTFLFNTDNGTNIWRKIIDNLTLNETFDHCLCVRQWYKATNRDIPHLIKWCNAQLNFKID